MAVDEVSCFSHLLLFAWCAVSRSISGREGPSRECPAVGFGHGLVEIVDKFQQTFS